MTPTLHHADSRDVVAGLADESIDAVVTDPPYGIAFAKKKWDAGSPAFDATFWLRVRRALRPGSYVAAFGATRTYHRMATALETAGFEIRDSLHWITGQGLPRGERLKPAHEPIVLARKGTRNCRRLDLATTRPPRGSSPTNLLLDETAARGLDLQSGDRDTSFGKSLLEKPSLLRMGKPIRQGRAYKDRGGASRFFNVFHGVFKYEPKVMRARVHETQKPLAVMEWLVTLVSRPGDTVFDPFMGSGTTGVACHRLKRAFIGVEKDARHFETAARRLAEEP